MRRPPVIKQFNFYDVYGYLLPGLLLLVMFWLPIGILTQSWPDQDLSKALFLAALTYIAGHILQNIAISVVPSTVRDAQGRPRVPSDLFLDRSNGVFGSDFKAILAQQVRQLFNLDLAVNSDGDGKTSLSTNRNTAFYQARSYLIVKKSAHYAEQFEGLYAMMRGLACALLAGALYVSGWGISFYRQNWLVQDAMAGLLAASIAGSLFFSAVALAPKANAKKAVLRLAACLLAVVVGAGYWVSNEQPVEFWRHAPVHCEWILWACSCVALIAAARCYAAYKSFASLFAQTVSRDFSACLSIQEAFPDSAVDDADDD